MDLNELLLDEEGAFSLSGFQEFTFLPRHQQLSDRVRKRLYYGWDKDGTLDNLSSPVADIAVEILQKAAPSPIRRLQKKYVSHVSREACISPCSMMLALVYIERLRHRNPEYLQQISSSDLFLISMMVASKYLYDEGEEEEVFNDEWGAAGKVDVQTMNTLEMNFLRAIDWSLYTDPKELFEVLSWVEGCVAERQGIRRGWFTYTDLCVLMDQTLWHQTLGQFYQQVAKLVCILGMAYLTGIAVVLVSTAVLHHTLHMKKAGPVEFASAGRQLAPCLPLSSPVLELDHNLAFPNRSLPPETHTFQGEQQESGSNGVMATALCLWSSILNAIRSLSPISISPSLCPHCSQPATWVATNHTICTRPAAPSVLVGLTTHCTTCSCWNWHLSVSPSCKDCPLPPALQQCPSLAALELGKIKTFMFLS